jgi:hypothetical protein
MLDALIGGPDLALRYAASLRPCDGGAVVDLDRRRVLFFGEPLVVSMNERRALMDVLATVWSGYEIAGRTTAPKNLRDMWEPSYGQIHGTGSRRSSLPVAETNGHVRLNRRLLVLLSASAGLEAGYSRDLAFAARQQMLTPPERQVVRRGAQVSRPVVGAVGG